MPVMTTTEPAGNGPPSPMLSLCSTTLDDTAAEQADPRYILPPGAALVGQSGGVIGSAGTGFVVRPRDETDLIARESIARLVRDRDGYPAYLPGGDLRNFVASSDALAAWVADDGDIIGHVALHANASRRAIEMASDHLGVAPSQLGVVARLLVVPIARRRGVGRALLDTAVVSATTRGLVPILDVVTTYNLGRHERTRGSICKRNANGPSREWFRAGVSHREGTRTRPRTGILCGWTLAYALVSRRIVITSRTGSWRRSTRGIRRPSRYSLIAFAA